MATEDRELIRDYISPDGKVLRVTARVPAELLTWPLGRTFIERDFESARDIKMKQAKELKD